MSISRRDFLGAGAAAAAGLALPRLAGAELVISSIVDRSQPAPTRPASRPVIISAGNGMEKDSEGKQGIKVAWDLLTSGADPLDAIDGSNCPPGAPPRTGRDNSNSGPIAAAMGNGRVVTSDNSNSSLRKRKLRP